MLTEEVSRISSRLPNMNKSSDWSTLPMYAQNRGRTMLEKVGVSPTLKLPSLFSLTPNSSGKGGYMQKKNPSSSQIYHTESLSYRKSSEDQSSSNTTDNLSQEKNTISVLDIKRSVREAALSVPSCIFETSRDDHSEDGFEHFFVPVSSAGISHHGLEKKQTLLRNTRLFSEGDASFFSNRSHENHGLNKLDVPGDVLHELDSASEYGSVNGFHSTTGSIYAASESLPSLYDLDETPDQVFSPPLLMETSLFGRLL